jgi:SAM-dependent methyltransferase
VSLAEPEDRSLRTTFDTVAELYDRVRPPLPGDLLDVLAGLAGLPPRGRVLEVGPGTGRVTVELARRGYDVLAVELGANLAAVARRNLEPFPNAQVVVGAFEEWTAPPEPFDVVCAFHAWHWLDGPVALDTAAGALRPGGALAIVGGQHVAGGDTEYFHAVQECYERFMPGTPPGLRLAEPDAVPSNDWGTIAHAQFAVPVHRRWLDVTAYTTSEYVEFMRTASGHIALDDANRDALLACLAEHLERDYGGEIRRASLIELCVARRV